MFYDRDEAAQKLAHALKQYQHEDAIVLAVPRGAVPMGKIVASALNLPLDIILIKKIGHPVNKEYAIGAVGLNDDYFNDNESMVSQAYVDQEISKIRACLKDSYKQYMGDKKPLKLYHKTVIIIDDGIATGSTLLATIKLARKKGVSKIIIASPVGPPGAIKRLREAADDVVCLEIHPDFEAVGQYYEHFNQVSDEEVSTILHGL